MKKRQRILIGIHADHVRVHTLRNGRIDRSACVPFEHDAASDTWDDGLRCCDGALTQALEEAGVATPCEARVVYDSPTAAVSAGPTPASGNAGAQAALLELETRGGADLSLQAHAAWTLGSERDGSGYCVAITDSPLTLDTLSLFCERAGVTMLSATPSEAVGLSGALAMHARATDEASRVCAWFGSWCSGVVVADTQGVRFVRSSPLTQDALVGSLSAVRGLDRALATKMLQDIGVPGSDQASDPQAWSSRVDMHDARASIQPLIQRTAVDLRQSLRFGLGKDAIEHATVRAGGDATAIVGLVPLIGELLDIRHDIARTFNEHEHVVEAVDRLRLVDDGRSERTKGGRVQRALWSGAAAALGVSGAQGLMAMDEASREQAALTAMRAGETNMEAIYAREETAERLEVQLARVERAAQASAGFGPRWPGWLADLAERCPERVVILGMSGTRNADEAGVVMMTGAIVPEAIARETGTLDPDDTSTQIDHLNAFISSLKQSPLVETVELGPTRRGSALGEDATSFELSVTLYAAPTIAEVHDG